MREFFHSLVQFGTWLVLQVTLLFMLGWVLMFYFFWGIVAFCLVYGTVAVLFDIPGS